MCLKVRGSEIQRSLKKQKKPLNAQHFHNSFLRFTQLHQQIRWTRSVIAPQKCCKQACASQIIIPIFRLAALSESFVHCRKRQNYSWQTYQLIFFHQTIFERYLPVWEPNQRDEKTVPSVWMMWNTVGHIPTKQFYFVTTLWTTRVKKSDIVHITTFSIDAQLL